MRYVAQPFDTARCTLRQLAEYTHRQLRRISQAMAVPETLWVEDVIDLGCAHEPAANPPTWTKVKDNGAGSTGVFAWLFDAITEQSLEGSWSARRRRKSGAGIKPVLRFSPNGNGAGTIVWGLEYALANPDGTFGSTSIVYAILAVAANAQYDHLVAKFDELAGASIDMGASVLFRVFRATGHGSHTLTDDAFGIELAFNYQQSTPGSDLEYLKRVET